MAKVVIKQPYRKSVPAHGLQSVLVSAAPSWESVTPRTLSTCRTSPNLTVSLPASRSTIKRLPTPAAMASSRWVIRSRLRARATALPMSLTDVIELIKLPQKITVRELWQCLRLQQVNDYRTGISAVFTGKYREKLPIGNRVSEETML
jgi:hypothetical protein